MSTQKKARLRLGRHSQIKLPKGQSRTKALALAKAKARAKELAQGKSSASQAHTSSHAGLGMASRDSVQVGFSSFGAARTQAAGRDQLGLKRAVIVGPRVGSAREFSRTLFEVGIDPQTLIRDLRVAVDGGLKVFRQIGWKPHFAVGDWDSLKPEKASTALRGIFHLTLPRQKDRSDLYYACRAAISAGASELVCVGVTGGRPDHQLATLMDLSEISSLAHGPRAVIAADAGAQYYFLSEHCPLWEANLRAGQVVSIFAMSDEVSGITLEGFSYPLKNAALKPSSHGLSNEVVQGQVSVRLKRGRLVILVLSPTSVT